MKTTTEIGRFGEKIAVDHLKANKYKILEQNYFSSHNEIDIIAENKQFIVFVEVKTRSCQNPDDMAFGTPASAVTLSKQKRTIAAAQNYLASHKIKKVPRLDVIEIYLLNDSNHILKLNHIENAFQA